MGHALMGAPLSFVLLFSLFSFLFGVLLAVFSEGYRAVFSALHLFSLEGGVLRTPLSSLCPLRNGKKKTPASKKSRKGRPSLSVIGCFLYDLSLWVLLASFYMIFLYAANNGIFRFYSLLFTVLGFFLLRKMASRLFFRPLLFLLSWLFSALGLLLRLPLWLSLRFFRFVARKKRKMLDEKCEMV